VFPVDSGQHVSGARYEPFAPLILLVGLALVMALGCSTIAPVQAQEQAHTSGEVRSDAVVYQLSAVGELLLRLHIRNASADTIFLGRCGSVVGMNLLRRDEDETRALPSYLCPAALGPAFAVAPGEERVEVARFATGVELARRDLIGTLSVIIDAYSTRRAAETQNMAFQIADRRRSSNWFQVRER